MSTLKDYIKSDWISEEDRNILLKENIELKPDELIRKKVLINIFGSIENYLFNNVYCHFT